MSRLFRRSDVREVEGIGNGGSGERENDSGAVGQGAQISDDKEDAASQDKKLLEEQDQLIAKDKDKDASQAENEPDTKEATAPIQESPSNAITPQKKEPAGWLGSWRSRASLTESLDQQTSAKTPDQGDKFAHPVAEAPTSDTINLSDPAQGHRWGSWIPKWTPASAPELAAPSDSTAFDGQVDKSTAMELGKESPNPLVQAAKNPATRQHWVRYFSSNKLEDQLRRQVDDEASSGNGKDSDSSMETMTVPKLDKSEPDLQTDGKNGASKTPESYKKRKTGTRSPGTKEPVPTPVPLPTDPIPTATPSRSSSPGPPKDASQRSGRPKAPKDINHLILPTWADSFLSGPRSKLPPQGILSKTLSAVNSYFSMQPPSTSRSSSSAARSDFGPVPRAWSVIGKPECTGVDQVKRIVIVAVHGWMPGTLLRAVLGQPTGTSSKFGRETLDALRVHLKSHYGIELCKEAEEPIEKSRVQVETILLESDGKVDERIERFHRDLLEDESRMKAIEDADAIIWTTHSQGAIVSTGLLATLIQLGHVRPSGYRGPIPPHARRKPYEQRICMLAMCGINRGPMSYLYNQLDSLFAYVERPAARELFEYQNPESKASLAHAEATRFLLDSGVKVTLVASLQDQVVPVYSALFEGLSHSHILRAIYVDEIGYHATTFISNLIVFAIRLRNAGLYDHGLLVHLSEAVSGSLTGLGHSTIYGSSEVYTLALRHLFDTSSPSPMSFSPLLHTPMTPTLESFDTRKRVNPYLLPYALRGITEDSEIRRLFAEEMQDLRDGYDDWLPQNKAMAEMKWRLEPIKLGWGHTSSSSFVRGEASPGVGKLLQMNAAVEDKSAKL